MEEIIRARHLKKYFRDVRAVDDISFTVYKGELFGFLGVNGAGKSTTIQMLCTLSRPTGGEAMISGLCLGKDNEEIKSHIGVVYQNNCLDKRLTVKENLLIRGSLYEPDKKRLSRNLNYVLELLDLTETTKRQYVKLSGGQKRRCEIAAALMHAPDILFLDEPTTGLDPSARESVWKMIADLQEKMGMTVFLTTHYMEEAARANHIAIMNKGHLMQYGTPFELKDRFAKDKLRLIPGDGMCGETEGILNQQHISYKVVDGQITMQLDRTMDALPIVEDVRQMLDGFEVVQGTMDDVFLNAAGGGNNNETI